MSEDLETGEEEQAFVLDETHAGTRLDKALSDIVTDLSRTRIRQLIEGGEVRLDGKVCESASCKVKGGEEVTINVPPPVDSIPQPENIPLEIVYEDEYMLVINKQAGLVVHPGAGNWTGTLVNALLFHCGDSLSGIGGVKRPGIVHRLDKETSGLMVVAKSDRAHQGLAAQLADRSLSRIYHALVWRVPFPAKGKIEEPIGRHPSQRQKMAVNRRNGKEAGTHYRVLESYGRETASCVECKLESGRMHQIRVHMAHIGHPVIGDPLYGLQSTAARSLLRKGGYEEDAAEQIMDFPRQALHAKEISFIHPVSGIEMHFESDLPADIEGIISFLNQYDIKNIKNQFDFT